VARAEIVVGAWKNIEIRLRNGGDEAVEAAVELFESRWIRASEQLPEPRTTVIVLQGEDLFAGWMEVGGWWRMADVGLVEDRGKVQPTDRWRELSE
jgi:hypothetical protein